MPLDGLTIKVLTNELKELLRNGRVLKIKQPDEATVTLQMRLPGCTETLLLSADPVYPRFHTMEENLLNPQTPPNFCMLLRKYLEPGRLLTIEQQGFDRIVQLRFETIDELGRPAELSLVLEIMSRQSNLYLVDSQGMILDALRRVPGRDILPGRKYMPPSDQGKLDPASLSAEQFVDEIRLMPGQTPVWKWLADSFQGFSAAAAKEVLCRAGLDTRTVRLNLPKRTGSRFRRPFPAFFRKSWAGEIPHITPTPTTLQPTPSPAAVHSPSLPPTPWLGQSFP